MIFLFILSITLVTFIIMEGITWVMHKYVMHGFLWYLHEDNYKRSSRRSRRQDPLVKVLTSATFIRAVFGILKKIIK